MLPDAPMRAILAILALAVVLVAAPTHAEELPIDWPGRSVEGPGGSVVLPPQPTPPDLLLEDDDRIRRADLLLERAEVLDAFVARFARQARRLLDADAPDCEALATLEAAIALSRSASSEAALTARAELATLPEGEVVEPRRERARSAAAREAVVVTEAWPSLERALRARCAAMDAPPTVWLPAEEQEPVADRIVVFVRGEEPRRVVFADGIPAGVTGTGGWAVLVAGVGAVELCVAEPDRDTCAGAVRVTAAAAAFDLAE